MKKIYLRSDTAGYQEELLLYCGEGKDPRIGVIEFAIGADVTEAFREAVRATAESEWKPLIRWVDGKPQQTDQEWAEVAYVPELGRIQPQAGGLPLPGDPRTAAATSAGRRGRTAVSHPGVRPARASISCLAL